MTLLELLRQELPKHGGWPEGTNFIAQDSYDSASPGKIYAYENKPEQCETYWVNGDDSDGYGNFVMKSEIIAEDSTTAIVTREQYEATGWDGTNLPPVGCECELSVGVEFYTHSGSTDFEEGTTVVVGGTVNFGLGDFVAVKVKGTNVITDVNPCFLRPLRTEAERAIDEMVQLSGVSTGAAKILYDAGYRKG